MAQCYNCKYFRSTENKCGYSGYSRTANSDCGIAELRPYGERCCGNCKYYRPEEKRCLDSGLRHDPWDSCTTYNHKQA